MKFWEREFKRYEKTGQFSDKAVYEADGWTKCAFGEQVNALPKRVRVKLLSEDASQPEDRELDKLGVQFQSAVEANNCVLAKKLYKQIGDRITKLAAKHS